MRIGQPAQGLICAVTLAASLAFPMRPAAAQTCPSDMSQDAIEKARASIMESERLWVESLITGKTEDINRIFGEDFLGVDSDGKQYDKATFMAEVQEAPKYFVSNRLNDVKVRFFCNMAVAQGDETWERRMGEPKRGRFVFTDTFALRDGTWQVVATESLIAPEIAK